MVKLRNYGQHISIVGQSTRKGHAMTKKNFEKMSGLMGEGYVDSI
jgi:hypothetical protein